MNWYALEDGDEDAGNGETDDKVIAPKEDTPELYYGKDAILKENTRAPRSSDIITLCIRMPSGEI